MTGRIAPFTDTAFVIFCLCIGAKPLLARQHREGPGRQL